MSTPHIQAEIGQIAKVVMMPGDPLRAKFIAEKFLEEAKLVTSIRNVLGYTGTYKGKEITVMASGMGMPSIGIYASELFMHYGVEQIIRLGSCGAYDPALNIYDTVLVTSSYSESTFAKEAFGIKGDTLMPTPELNEELKKTAQKCKIALREVVAHSTDVFYRLDPSFSFASLREQKNTAVVEMESFGLFAVAKHFKKQVACLLTVSDSLVTSQQSTAQEREQSFTNMMKIALETV